MVTNGNLRKLLLQNPQYVGDNGPTLVISCWRLAVVKEAGSAETQTSNF